VPARDKHDGLSAATRAGLSLLLLLLAVTLPQVGWMTGPAHLLAPIIKAHQFVVFTVASNLQHAVAYGLDEADWFYK
jgi:hypothetical protein